MKVSFSGIFQGYDTIGIPYAMHAYEMTVIDHRQANLGEFEQASQKLLLNISLTIGVICFMLILYGLK